MVEARTPKSNSRQLPNESNHVFRKPHGMYPRLDLRGASAGRQRIIFPKINKSNLPQSMVNVRGAVTQESKLGLETTMVYSPFGRDRVRSLPDEKSFVTGAPRSTEVTVAVKSLAGSSTERTIDVEGSCRDTQARGRKDKSVNRVGSCCPRSQHFARS